MHSTGKMCETWILDGATQILTQPYNRNVFDFHQ